MSQKTGPLRRAIVLAACLIVLAVRADAAETGAGSGPSAHSATAWFAQDGLPAGDVLAIAQDRDGYLWLGMSTGLVRFDGYQFLPWGARGEPPLGGASVRAVLGARDGSVWVGYGDAGGVTRIQDGRVDTFPGGTRGLAPGNVAALLEDGAGTVWAATSEGLSAFAQERWRRIAEDAGLAPGEVFSLYEDSRGAIWAGTSAGVFRTERDGAGFVLVDDESKFVESFVERQPGEMWVTDSQNVIRRLGRSGFPQYADGVRLPTAGWRLLRAADESLWIAALGGGLLRVRAAGAGAPVLVERAPTSDTVTGSPRALFQDRQNNVWVGMRGGGLVRFSETIFTTDVPLEGLTNDGVRALAASADGRVWVATGHQLNAFEGGARRVFDVTQTLALHVDREQTLWAATALAVGRFMGGRLSLIDVAPEIRLERVVSITTDPTGRLWLCSLDQGLLTWNDDRVVRYTQDPAITGMPCSFLHTDRSGRVWIAFSRIGVATYESGHFTLHGRRDGAPAGVPLAIAEDATDAIWISTASTLTRYRNGRFTTIGPNNGLPGEIIASVVDDEQGYIWVSVNSGAQIVRFSRTEADAVAADGFHQLNYSLFDASDGLQGDVHWQSRPGAVRAGDGRLWFVTGLGVAIIDPRRPRPTRAPASLRLERVMVNGQPVDLDAPPRQLPPGASIRIDYSVPNLAAGSKFRFRHLLEGADAAWRDAGAMREATYASLSPGTYRLRVSATGAEDSPHSEAVWSFTIGPPFYQARWFYAAAALGAGLLVWGSWQLRLRTVRKQFALVVAERTRVSREIHDTLLQSLGAVALELEAVARELDTPQHTSQHTSRDSLRKLRAKVRNCIREARQSIWELRSPLQESRSLADALRELADDASASGNVEVKAEAVGRTREFGTDIAHHLLRIAQEATNNAIRHGHPRHVRIELVHGPDALQLRVSDDGCGFASNGPSPDPARDRWGLVNMRERAERIGGTLTVSSSPGGGTVVETTVPS